jgi:hypothetical protein
VRGWLPRVTDFGIVARIGKKQKLLHIGVSVKPTRTSMSKSFLVLFFKKEPLASLRLLHRKDCQC